MDKNTNEVMEDFNENKSESKSLTKSEKDSLNNEKQKIDVEDLPKTNVNTELKRMQESEEKVFDDLLKENALLSEKNTERDKRIKDLEEINNSLTNDITEEKNNNKKLRNDLSSLQEQLEFLKSGAANEEDYRQLNNEIRYLQDRLKALAKEESDRDKKLRNYEAQLLLQKAWNVKLERELGEEKLKEIKDINTDEQVMEESKVGYRKNIVYTKEPVSSAICSVM